MALKRINKVRIIPRSMYGHAAAEPNSLPHVIRA